MPQHLAQTSRNEERPVAGKRFRTQGTAARPATTAAHRAPAHAGARHAQAVRPTDAQPARRTSGARQGGARAAGPSGGVQPAVNAAEAALHVARDPRGGASRTGHQRWAVVLGIVLGCVIGALLIFVVGGALMNVVLSNDAPAQDAAAIEGAQGDDEASTSQQTVVLFAEGGEIEYANYTYSILQGEDGSYAFAYQLTGAEADPLPRFTIPGTPVGFACYNNVFYVVSNTEDGYLIQSFIPGDGSLPVDFLSGTETVTSIALEGSVLTLDEEGGRTYTVDLASEA